MNRLYSTIMMLAIMVAALSLTACGGDDDSVGGDSGGDNSEYFQISINGETYDDPLWKGAMVINYMKKKDGVEIYPYGGLTEQIRISEQDALQYALIVGYTDIRGSVVNPNPVRTYDIISNRGQYAMSSYSDNVGMIISGGNMSRRTVTSGSLNITKTSKMKRSVSANGRSESYVTEGTFSFTLTDDWNGNENIISGKFRVIF